MTGVYVADGRVVAGRGVGAFTAPIFVRGLLMQNQTRRKITYFLSADSHGHILALFKNI